MTPRAMRPLCRRASRCAAVAGGLLLLLAAWLLPPAAPPLRTTARFPRVAPPALAHLLADFSTHLLLYPHLGEWSVEEESSNYTAWHYAVSYSCGARCSGRATVLALDDHPGEGGAAGRPRDLQPGEGGAAGRPRDLQPGEGGAAGRHTVRVAHRACAPALPLLTWPLACDEWETETYIVGDGSGGAVMSELARARCGGAGAGGAGCAGGLRAARDRHLQRLRAILSHSES